MSASPCRKCIDISGGWMPNFCNAPLTACGSITGSSPVKVASQASTVPTRTAASPPGTPPGRRTRAPRNEDDPERDEGEPGDLPALERRAHRDEGDRNARERSEHRGTR